MTARTLGILTGLVAVAAIAGWWWLRSDDATAPSPPVAAQGSAGPSATAGAPATPELPERRAVVPEADPSVREYRSGDYEVRDHRTPTGDERPRDVPPNVHPPGARQLPSSLTHAITAPLREAVAACAASVPADARGTKPRLEGVVTVAIKNHQLAISESAMQARDVTGAAADAVRDCVAGKAIGASVPARDQEDLDSYTINIAFAIP